MLSLPSSLPVDYYYYYDHIPSSNLLPPFQVYVCWGNTAIFILLTSRSGIMHHFGIQAEGLTDLAFLAWHQWYASNESTMGKVDSMLHLKLGYQTLSIGYWISIVASIMGWAPSTLSATDGHHFESPCPPNLSSSSYMALLADWSFCPVGMYLLEKCICSVSPCSVRGQPLKFAL